MRHVRAIGFDALEDRRLLSAAHHVAKPHTKPMIPAGTPISLNGMLQVDNAMTSSLENVDGSTTDSTPVVGTVATLGKVTGVWNENLDEYGENTGVDVLRLANSKGSVIITFNTETTAKAHSAGHDEVYYARARNSILPRARTPATRRVECST